MLQFEIFVCKTLARVELVRHILLEVIEEVDFFLNLLVIWNLIDTVALPRVRGAVCGVIGGHDIVQRPKRVQGQSAAN